MIDIRIRTVDDKIEKSHEMKETTTLNDIGLCLLELENVKRWLLDKSEDFEPEIEIKK